jgi:hypothetical protein
MMGRVLEKEWFRSLMLALILLGVGFMLFAVVRYGVLSYQIGQNLAYQAMNRAAPVEAGTGNEAMGLIRAGQELREMTAQQNQSIIFLGAGMILIALGWLGRDMAKSRLKKLSAQAVHKTG